MSRDEPFLARWSRKKREVAARSDAEKHRPNAAETAKPAAATAGEAPPVMPLPPIESIESASDIKAFLAPGVPLELTREAFRRVWTADPAIRDFVGLSENAWDFNAQGGVPGFDSLAAQDVRRLVAQVLGEPQLADPIGPAAVPADNSTTLAEAEPAVAAAEPRKSIVAPQHENDETRAPKSRRRHGGALPQ